MHKPDSAQDDIEPIDSNVSPKALRKWKVIVVAWLAIWVGCFAGLIGHLYHGGELTIWVWLGFILLGFVSPDIVVEEDKG